MSLSLEVIAYNSVIFKRLKSARLPQPARKTQRRRLVSFPSNFLSQGHHRRGQGLVKWLLLIAAATRTKLKNALKLSSAPASQDRQQGQQGLCPLVLKVILLGPSFSSLKLKYFLMTCMYYRSEQSQFHWSPLILRHLRIIRV